MIRIHFSLPTCVFLVSSLFVSGGIASTSQSNNKPKIDYQNIQKGGYSGSYYIVREGDTLFYISYISGKTVDELAKINHLAQPYVIRPGQKINIWQSTYVPPAYGKATEIASNTAKNEISTKSADQTEQIAQSTQQNEKAFETQNTKTYSEKSSTPANSPSPTTTNKQQITVADNSVVLKDKVKTENITNLRPSWHWPADGRIIGNFSKSKKGKQGIDIAGDRGQKVMAAADGRVVYAGNALRGYGNLIIIKHGDNYISAYAHNDNVYVMEDDTVKQGQKIAAMGSSGTQNVLLHFEIRYKGKSVDPLSYLPKK